MSIIIYLILCATIVTAKIIPKKDCKDIKVNGKPHRMNVILNGLNRPYQLAIYKSEDRIFFSYNDGEDSKDTFGIGYVNKNEKIFREVKGVPNGFALAINHHSKTIYFGGSDGIFSSNLTNIETLSTVLMDHNIWDLFYHKNCLYFIQFHSQRLYKYNIEEKTVMPHEQIKDKIFQFAIDGHDDIFFTTKDGLFELKNGTDTPIPYSGPKVYRAIEVNNVGVAHFCAQNGIYIPDKDNHNLTEIANIKNIFGITFDVMDYIIYSNPHEIIELLPEAC